MILAAEYIPSLLQLMLGRHSGIGNRIPRFPGLGGISRFPIPEWPGIGNRETGRFPFGREPGIGVPIRRAGDFLVWLALLAPSLSWIRAPLRGCCLVPRAHRAQGIARGRSCLVAIPAASPYDARNPLRVRLSHGRGGQPAHVPEYTSSGGWTSALRA